MRAVVHAGALVGIEAHPVEVEVQVGKGLPGTEVLGLADRGVRESSARVRAALAAQGFELPPRHLVVNLAPGDLPKSGSGFDLAIAVATLAGCELLTTERLADHLLVGELSLGGDLRPVRGVLAQLRSAAARGLPTAVVPAGNAAEASLATGIDVRCARTLREVVDHLAGRGELPDPDPDGPPPRPSREDLRDVRGQASAKRALEIAAAGQHHVLMVGPPGSGKTMLARRLPGLLPPPTPDEVLTIATVASAAGLAAPAIGGRPFRAPHHTASTAALIGGGEPVRPGEVTLAHLGVLFLDELPELRRDAIEALRTVMEGGVAVVARVRCRVTMPAQPLVVAAMNPCPCGYDGDPRRLCLCPPDRADRYRARVSGPLLDRFDLHVAVPRVPVPELQVAAGAEPSDAVRERVTAARERSRRRGRGREPGIAALVRETRAEAVSLLERATERLGLSVRAFVKVLRVARTIADLEGAERVEPDHVAEAVQYRLLDRRHAWKELVA